jgi:predicted nicotinamide N-methyase
MVYTNTLRSEPDRLITHAAIQPLNRNFMSSLRISYQTVEFGEVDIHLRTLRDRQQYPDNDNTARELGISPASWSLFGVVWDSGEVLAHFMFDFRIKGKRILEVGCGIGLASLVLNHRLANITATDYHPEAEYFLQENVTLNKGNAIPFVMLSF